VQEITQLRDMLTKLPVAERYTYNFQGRSQALDHVFVTDNLYSGSRIDVQHINTGLVNQTSDHDPTLVVVRSLGVYHPC
jgi:uncharacterized protein